MFGIRSRKSNPGDTAPMASGGGHMLGLDINSTRARAVVAAGGQLRTVPLEPSQEELPLILRLDARRVEIGQSASGVCRVIPHDICSGYLALLGQSHEWRGSRHTVTPDMASKLTLDAIQYFLISESRSIGVALPTYLNSAQVRSFRTLAHECQIPVKGTVAAPLAIAAHRAANIGSDGTALIIDADDYALMASLVAVTSTQVRILNSGLWPQLSLRVWKNCLIDAISDRCVRICRRDPRDSAVAEQGLYDQLNMVMDAVRQGQKLNLTLRADHWYQDLPHTPEEVEVYCAGLAASAANLVQSLLGSSSLPTPPRTIWLTQAASQLPGLAARVFRDTSEHTAIGMLPPNAAAEAVAALVPRWESARLDTTHQADGLPWERLLSSTAANTIAMEPPPARPSPPAAVRPSLPSRKVPGGADAQST